MAAIHIKPTAALADRALLPGDPGRALMLAQALLSEPLMFNHSRGLWGYTGVAADGEPLTIQSTGMGGPSAAIVLSELIDLGLRRAVRVGTCGALEEPAHDTALELGELLVAESAIAADGTSRALGAGERVAADRELTAALRAAAPAGRFGTVVSTDLFYAPAGADSWSATGALAVEMEAATLFTLGAARGIQVACALVVTDVLGSGGGRRRIEDDLLVEAGERVGRLGARALVPS